MSRVRRFLFNYFVGCLICYVALCVQIGSYILIRGLFSGEFPEYTK